VNNPDIAKLHSARNQQLNALGPYLLTFGPELSAMPKNNAPCDYTYTGSSGKQEVTLELSKILRELLIAIHVT